MEPKPLPIIGQCSLDDDELALRMSQWSEVLSKAESTRAGDVATYSLPSDQAILDSLNKLIEQEATCCPHLVFSLSTDANTIKLTISNQP